MVQQAGMDLMLKSENKLKILSYRHLHIYI